MTLPTIFDLCEPRADVVGGKIKESDFAADLAQVLNDEAPPEYKDPKIFFANTHPTKGLRSLLKNVCLRLSGTGGEASSIFRLDTQYGGGKTHSLIALSHAARGMKGVTNIDEFIDPALLPKGGKVRVGAFDGENADPINGRPLDKDLRAFTPWGELAYALAGAKGYKIVKASDEKHVAPGADTLRELFGGQPTLILLDELSVYVRKVKGRPEAGQLTAFLTSLFKAVESSPGAAMVFTLAIGKGWKAVDAYSAENEFVARQLDEAESVAARKATLLDPTTEGEVAQVLRRRLFADVNDAGARKVIDAYDKLWITHAGDLPTPRKDEDRRKELADGFPLHPALMSTLTDKLSTLSNFQRVRGMLRLLTQTVAWLWKQKPQGTHAIHIHHLDPGYEPTRNEVVTRLELGAFDPAIRNDVAATGGGASLAQELDAKSYAGMAPYGSFVARSILWHTYAFNEALKGVTAEELRYCILGPGMDLGFINDARQKFIASSAYLDDRPSVPLRFLTEANLTQMIRRQETQVDPGEALAELRDRIQKIFQGSALNLVPFAGGPNNVPDEVGDGRPILVLISHDALTVSGDLFKLPKDVADIFERKGSLQGSQREFRSLRNNLVFLVADGGLRGEMEAKVVRRLALEAMKAPDRLEQLAAHQQDKVRELYQRSEQEIAVAIQQCFRHLFFPSRSHRVGDEDVDLGHTAFDTPSASDSPGAGQKQVVRALKDMNKLLQAEDNPLAPKYVRDFTPLKKGQISTAELRAEFRKDPRLPIMLGDENFVKLVRKGIEDGMYVYKRDELLAGEGDPWCDIKVDQQSLVFTMDYAKAKAIWPRPAPRPSSGPVSPGEPSKPYPTGGSSAVVSIKEGTTLPPVQPGTQVFTAEAPLREALTRIWEDARAKGVASLSVLSLRVFDAQDAFRLLGAVNAVSGAERKVAMAGEYETKSGSSFSVEFTGVPNDAEPLKEFLVPQFRAAKAEGSETSLETTYTLTFTDGLELGGDEPNKLTERLARFATGAVYVEARAEAKA
jgi:hypothetical protein